MLYSFASIVFILRNTSVHSVSLLNLLLLHRLHSVSLCFNSIYAVILTYFIILCSSVCVYAHMCVCIYAYVHVHLHVHMRLCVLYSHIRMDVLEYA